MGKKSKRGDSEVLYGMRPVDGMAAKVMGMAGQSASRDPSELRFLAEGISNPQKKEAMLKLASEIERRSRAAKKAAVTRLTNKTAEKRARHAMEVAKWRRENSRG